jgi:hypothetical protein
VEGAPEPDEETEVFVVGVDDVVVIAVVRDIKKVFGGSEDDEGERIGGEMERQRLDGGRYEQKNRGSVSDAGLHFQKVYVMSVRHDETSRHSQSQSFVTVPIRSSLENSMSKVPQTSITKVF